MVLERLSRLQLFDLAKELRCLAKRTTTPTTKCLRSYLLTPLLRNLRERKGLPVYAWLDASACDTLDPAWIDSCTTDRGRDPSHLNRILYRETRHTNIPAVLMYSDRNAMAHSVEARFPYLDHRLVELCFSLPASYKVGFGRRKKLLFETARQHLPQMVVESKAKKRFVLMNNWMPLRGEHAASNSRGVAQLRLGRAALHRRAQAARLRRRLPGRKARERLRGLARLYRVAVA